MNAKLDTQIEDSPETPLLEKLAVPPLFTRMPMDKLAEQPLLRSRISFPTPAFAFSYQERDGVSLPQAIAHRGFKAKYPENTMAAFTAAVDVGAQALETDVHLTKDGVVVLSHDATLKRCFGHPGKVIDYDWKYISELRTIKKPPQPMPRLIDLLEYLTKPGLEEVWLLLDIKLDNNANDIMREIGEAMRQVPPVKERPWKDRVVLGCWAAKYLPLCDAYLPDFPISHIGFSLLYANQFFCVPNVSFNMLQTVLMGPGGSAFLGKARSLQRPVFAWTVNDKRKMRWCIKKQLDGVITDDPEEFIEVRDKWDRTQPDSLTLLGWLDVLRICLLAFLFGLLFKVKFGFRMDKRFVERAIEEQ